MSKRFEYLFGRREEPNLILVISSDPILSGRLLALSLLLILLISVVGEDWEGQEEVVGIVEGSL